MTEFFLIVLLLIRVVVDLAANTFCHDIIFLV